MATPDSNPYDHIHHSPAAPERTWGASGMGEPPQPSAAPDREWVAQSPASGPPQAPSPFRDSLAPDRQWVLDQNTNVRAPIPAIHVPPDFASTIVSDEIRHIQHWARDNQRDARNDRINFWMLKIPAILGGLGASALESFGYGPAVIILGLVTAVCVAVDGLHPRGRLHNVHKRAANELRALQDRLVTAINQAKLQRTDGEMSGSRVAEILAETQLEKDRISRYITSAEASLGEQQSGNNS